MERETILGVEGGGSKTSWVLVSAGHLHGSGKLPPSNLRLTPPHQLKQIFGGLPQDVDRVGIFLAGCVTEQDRATLLKAARANWARAHIVVGSDRESGLAACLQRRDGIVVNAGTGSSVTGRRGGRVENAGGWGHILGDTGGAYFVSIRALRVILRDYDLGRGDRKLGARVLAALALNSFDQLVRWARTAEKIEIASLAPLVFAAAIGGDEALQRIIHASASALADFVLAVSKRLQLTAPEVHLMGGLFEHQPCYVEALRTTLLAQLPEAQIALCNTAPELGAAWLAAEGEMELNVRRRESIHEKLALTEEPNAHSANLEKLSPREVVDLFIAEEKSVEAALQACAEELARAIELTARAISNHGRIFYVGAGSSGRLGILDAAEIPPTFGAPPELIQGIIAGGATALVRSVEGAEDDDGAGAVAVLQRNLSERDLVIGITANGRAPFVLGALRCARQTGARTILLTCNPKRLTKLKSDLEINLPTGPEIIAGSTRLKAGTATKVALNIISTGAMVRLGHVRGNLMIDLQPTNRKLRERAVWLVMQLGGCDRETARIRLERAGWNVRAALHHI
jgi:N-acetylmuramic acid 6-phosphate etherase